MISKSNIGQHNNCSRIGTIYIKYHHWEQPYITNWEGKLKERWPAMKPFSVDRGDKGIPHLLYQNNGDKLLRVIKAFLFSYIDTSKYLLKGNLKNIKENIRDVANFYPLISYSPNLIHFVECQTFSKYLNLLRRTKTKTVVSFRGGDILVNPWNDTLWKDNLLPSIFNYSDKLHFVSNYIRDQAIKLGAPEEKCIVIYPGVDIHYFSKSDKVQIPKVNNKIKLVTTGRLVWEKGVDYALGAMKHLVSRGYSLEYIIIGDGPDQRRLHFLRHEYGLDSIVHFLGKQSPAIVKDILEDADIYVQPSLSESICVAIMEACSMELPIVSTRVGGIPELVLDGENGFLVEPQNPEKLADAIEVLINNKSMRLKMGECSRQIVEQNFSLDNEVLNWEKFYLKSIG